MLQKCHNLPGIINKRSLQSQENNIRFVCKITLTSQISDTDAACSLTLLVLIRVHACMNVNSVCKVSSIN